MMQLTDKIAIVTGAGNGCGAGIAHQLVWWTIQDGGRRAFLSFMRKSI